MTLIIKFFTAAVFTLASLAMVGCSEYGYSRTAFNSKFLDKTIAQAEESGGKADAIESPTPDTKVLVYKRKTFDQENGNAKDGSARITFKKNASDVYMYASVEFVPE
jgi:hypothetical protein